MSSAHWCCLSLFSFCLSNLASLSLSVIICFYLSSRAFIHHSSIYSSLNCLLVKPWLLFVPFRPDIVFSLWEFWMCASKHQNKTQEKESKAKRSTSWLHLWTCMRLVLISLLSHFILLLRNTIQLLNVLYSKNPTAQLFLGQILIDWQVWQWGSHEMKKAQNPPQ